MLSSQVPPTRKSPRKNSKDILDTVGNLDTKQPIAPTRKAIKIRVRKQKHSQKAKNEYKKKQNGKGDSKGKEHLDMSKIKCFNCGDYGHFACDCAKACNDATIAQESEQKGKLETMLDLDSTSVCEECAMVCT